MSLGYSGKNRIKFAFFCLAMIIIAVIFSFLNSTIRDIRQEERKKVMLWADAVKQRNNLLEYTSELFEKLQQEELQKVELWKESQQMIMEVEDSQFLTFLLKIISNNKDIPIILTDANKEVITTMNIDEKIEIGKKIPESILSKFSKYKPLQVSYKGKVINYLYYSDSQMFNEIQEMINNMIHSFIVEVAQNSVSVPVIITNSDTTTILADGNISEKDLKKIKRESVKEYVQEEMSENAPIQIMLDKEVAAYIFYKDSELISNLMYYPLLLIVITILLAMIVYFTFHSFEKYEKNQLWVGMSKETAHQLGTPISSLMAWTEILKMKELDPNIISELDKDVHRLETIAERFSKVGSIPSLTREDVVQTTLNAINYMKNRTAKTVISNVITPEEPLYANLNSSLFAWVIENLWKNAIDAMQGKGTLTIEISQENDLVCIDISDTGKGIPRNKFKTIFQPGYTTKSRGWGLGLSLAQRIIKEYHHGKIVVKSSEIDKGTTFRISLPVVQ